MKKVGILTFQESLNYGALLQAYALKKTVENLSVEASIINYHSALKENQYSIGISSSKGLLYNAKSLLSYPIVKRRKKKFDEFRKDYLNINSYSYNTETIGELNEYYDYFICGSDQVWNPSSVRQDETYFLNFVEDKTKNISYAPSIGLATLDVDQQNFLKSGIRNINNLSVREKSGQRIILDITGRNAEVVLDPTLLADKDCWKQFIKPRSLKRKYIFLYMVKPSKTAVDLAKAISKKYGYDIVTPIKSIKDYKNCTRGFIGGPKEFVNEIANADYVVTTSFHGMMFSLIFHKNFLVVDTAKSGIDTSSRLNDFLNEVGLSERVFNGENKQLECNIDFERIDSDIDKLREKSMNFLRTSLN